MMQKERLMMFSLNMVDWVGVGPMRYRANEVWGQGGMGTGPDTDNNIFSPQG